MHSSGNEKEMMREKGRQNNSNKISGVCPQIRRTSVIMVKQAARMQANVTTKVCGMQVVDADIGKRKLNYG